MDSVKDQRKGLFEVNPPDNDDADQNLNDENDSP
jgi:hypothetical protein